MKKNIQYLLVLFSIVFLTSCGSNSKKDPIKSATTTVNGYYFSETEDSLVIDSYKSYTIKFKLNKDDFAFPKATVRLKSFDSKYGVVEPSTVETDDNGKGKFTYRPPSNMPPAGTTYVLQYVYEATTENASVQTLTQNITLTFNVSNTNGGKVSNLSISYLNTTCDEKQGIISHYNVHAADPYSREPIVGMDVDFSLINGVKIRSKSGTIKNNASVQFSDDHVDFLSQVSTADNLIILPTNSAAAINYIGGWQINDVGETLQLGGTYNNISNSNGLTYVIGNEKRLLGGFDGHEGTPTVAHVQRVDATTDSNGFAYFDVVYDAKLAGHNVVLESHGQENGQRFGIAKSEFLRVSDFIADDIEISNTGGEGLVPMHIWIKPSCIGEVSAIDITTRPSSYKIEPVEHCYIDVSKGKYNTGASGNTYLYVITDGNSTNSQTCKISWEGGAHSLK